MSGKELESYRSDLWNGNIGSMVTALPLTDPGAVQTQGMAYKYDQLNRIKDARALRNLTDSLNVWGDGPSYNNEYFNSFEYDPNGNIEEQQRFNEAGVQFDFLTYNYHVQQDPDGWDRTKRNRLNHVNDGGSASAMPDDLEDQGAFKDHNPSGGIDINVKNNSGYDQLGQLIRDHDDDAVSPSGEEIELISWRVDGKISEVKRVTSSTKKNLRFMYDAMGNRVAKKVYSNNTFTLSVLESVTYYVRDAQGKVMRVYENPNGGVSPSLELHEQHIYGSSRVGMRSVNIEMIQVTDPLATEMIEVLRGEKYFELTNHLGNVLVTISDQKLAIDNSGPIAYYNAEVMTFTDYYPFGSVMSERTWEAGEGYRYDFNGKEKNNEVKDEGNQQNYGFSIYDSRFGRFLSVDPFTKDYPFLTLYAFAENDVIRCIVLDGAEKVALSGTVPPEQYHKKDKSGNRVPETTHYTPLHIAQFKKQTEFLKNKYEYNTALQVSTGQEVLQALINETKSAGEITHLSIFSHRGVGRLANGGNVGGLFSKNDTGFYSKTVGGSETGSFKQLSTLINSGDIKFAKNANIFIDACITAGQEGNSSIDNFAEQLCLTTGANVYCSSGNMAQETPGTANGKFKIPDGQSAHFYKYSRIEEKYDDHGTEKTRFVIKRKFRKKC